MAELKKDVEAMQRYVYEQIKDPAIKRRKSITDFSFQRQRAKIVLGLAVRQAAYGEMAGHVHNHDDGANKSEKNSRHESHVVDGEVLIGRGWTKKLSDASLPSIFEPNNDYTIYKIN